MLRAWTLMLFIFFSANAFANHRWTINEASILLPLPSVQELGEAVPISRVLTSDRFKTVVEGLNPSHGPTRPAEGAEIAWIYLTAVRIDPCFREKFGEACRPQIRLVWQPLELQANKVVTIDSAVHTFHDLNEATLSKLLQTLQTLNSPFKDAFVKSTELIVNPVLAEDGYNSEYYHSLRDLILSTVADVGTNRIAVMRLDDFDSAWSFFAYDVQRDGSLSALDIPTATKADHFELFENLLQRTKEMVEEMKSFTPPVFTAFDGSTQRLEPLIGKNGFLSDKNIGNDLPDTPIHSYLRNSDRFPKDQLSELNVQLEAARNPNKTLFRSMDCISCHAATPVHSYLKGGSGSSIHSFHAFGYFIDQVSISDRMKAEAAKTARLLNGESSR